jgi:hypothetical protein
MTDQIPERWLNSAATQKQLKIKGCELMHRREAGKLIFEKRGNAYFYLIKTTSTQNNE